MGFKLIKHLESAQYNRKLFYLDRGAVDLPPIVDKNDIAPGSEARSLLTGQKWVLNTHYKWVYIDENWYCGCGGNTGDGETDPITPGEEPTIEGVKVMPANIKVGLGAKISFYAQVDGDEAISKAVTWTIKGNKSKKTVISIDGILTVAEDEAAKSITVTATSQTDTTKYGQAVVTVDANEEHPDKEVVTGIVIMPTNAEVILGKSMVFQGQVNGVNLTTDKVEFSLSGQENPNTEIDSESGLLKVAIDEASKVLIVTARAKADTRFYATATVSVVAEEDAQHPENINVTEVKVLPPNTSIGKGYSAQFVAQVKGVGNPSQAVVWRVSGHTSKDTRITANGTVFIGEDEQTNLVTVTAQSVYAPDKIGEAEIVVLEKDDPGVADTTIDAIIITPASAEMAQGTWLTFGATVIGKNNPPQGVKWELRGANTQVSYVSEQGTVVIGVGETAKSMQLVATSVADPKKFNIAYITIAEEDQTPATGIEDVPESPLEAKYVRERDKNGRAVWTRVTDKEDPTNPDPDPEITAITLSPEAATVKPGSVIQFLALVDGSNELSTAVTWSISGKTSKATLISSDGVLSIAEDETSRIIKVKATSVVDTSKSGNATIVVDPEADDAPQVTGFYLIPAEAELVRGKSMIFQTVITGINIADKSVKFQLAGNIHPETTISPDGVVTAHKKETSNVLIVTATSNQDKDYSDSSVISVIPEEMDQDPSEITSIQVLPTYTNVGRGRNAQFAVQVIGVNNPPADVVWSISGESDPATHISRDGILFVGAAEDLHEITVRATAIYEPDKFAEARANVVAEDTPGVDETRVDAVIITPPTGEVEKGGRITFRATVIGQNSPSQEVRWTLDGNTSNNTILNKFGVLNVGVDESAKVLRVTGISVADSTKMATAYITVAEQTVLPDTGIEDIPKAPFDQNYVRHMDATGKAVWLKYDEIPKDDPGPWVRTRDEEGNPVWVKQVDKYIGEVPEGTNTEYVRARDGEGNAFWKENVDQYLGEIPAEPIGVAYHRRRMEDGSAQWVEDNSGGRPEGPMYWGTYENHAAMIEAGVPKDAIAGDFVYVIDDETHNRCPAMYEIYDKGDEVLDYRFVLSFGRPPILGDKLNILFVLDNGPESTYLKDIKVLEDFDTNEKRYELFKSTSAWHLVTELHKGFWDTVLKHPDWYKMIVGMKREDGSTRAYLTCFTDDHEFEHHKDIDIANPKPIENTLAWTNTVQPGKVFTAGNTTALIQYLFNEKDMTMSILSDETVDPGVEPGVTPWATVIGEYSTLMNGTVIGPLENVTDPTGYVWVSEHEKFMIGSAGDGTQMFCYNIDTNDYFIFEVPNESREFIGGVEVPFSLATDVDERYFFMYINTTIGVWGDRVEKTAKTINWRPTGYSGLSDPGQLTKPSISLDGKYYMHTSTNPDTPSFTTFRFDTGNIVTEGPVDGVSSSAICLKNNIVFTNTPEGQIITFNFDPDRGSISEKHRSTPYACRYVVEATANAEHLLCVKVESKSNCPIWFVYDAVNDSIIAESANKNNYCEQTNPQAKSCTYELSTSGGERYLLSLADADNGYIIRYNEGKWEEVSIPFKGLQNDRHEYNQPVLMNNGDIIITQDAEGNPVAFDLVKMEIVDMDDILHPGGDPHMVQLDDKHFMWCTDQGSQLLRTGADGKQVVVMEIPEQQCIVFGFGRQSGRDR